jgi:beta-phosphoglucomutase
MKHKAIIFDLDGVLVSTDNLHFQAWKHIADIENLYFDEEMNHLLRGVSRGESLDIILKQNRKNLDEIRKKELLDIKNKRYVELLEQLSQQNILHGAISILDKLRSLNYLLAIGSSSKNARTILNKLNLTQYFNVIVDGNDIEHSKPNPEVFIKAADGLGIKYSQCMVIEDSNAGIQAAILANMTPIYISKEQKIDGVVRIEHLSFLEKYL